MADKTECQLGEASHLTGDKQWTLNNEGAWRKNTMMSNWNTRKSLIFMRIKLIFIWNVLREVHENSESRIYRTFPFIL